MNKLWRLTLTPKEALAMCGSLSNPSKMPCHGYALPARLGFVPYLLTHLLVGAIAIVLLSSIAESMGQRRPWLPALLLAALERF